MKQQTTPAAEFAAHLSAIRENLSSVILGKREVLDQLIIALLASGHVLLEDVPGVGKTTLAKSIALTIQGIFNRVQFTPDLLPTDILGSSVYNPREGTFTFCPGPIFANVLLADEVNRASPRTQSSLLEAMNEQQATIEGKTYPLPRPFIVLATENPVEYHGTYPLPEAQLDRFAMKLEMGYPSPDDEVSILFSQHSEHPIEKLVPKVTCEQVLDMQRAVREIKVDKTVARYVTDLAGASRRHPSVQVGVSPRGSLMLYRISQAAACLAGRDYVLPDDVKRMASRVLAHRLVLDVKSRYSGTSKEDVVQEILDQSPVPV